MAIEVVIVQHGDKERQPGDPGLTALGHAQAATTAGWLHVRRPIEMLVTSPLRRSVETGLPIAERFGLEPTIDDRFRERMNWDDPADQSLEQFLEDWRRASVDRSYVPRHGDSSHAAAARFLSGLDDLASALGRGTAAVVAHGGVTTDALRTICGDDRLRAEAPTLIDDGVPSCAVTTLRHDDGRWQVDTVPQTAHLRAIAP